MEQRSKKNHRGAPAAAGIFVAAILSLTPCYGKAVAAGIEPDNTAVQECLLKALESAPGNTTVDELRAQCQTEQMAAAEKEKKEGLVEERLYTDDENVLRPFTLMAHRQNYILLANYNPDPNNEI